MGFSETGAGSLDLRGGSGQARTLRSHLEMAGSKKIPFGEAAVFTPQLRVGWTYHYPLDDRSLTAGLRSQPDDFLVYGDDRPAGFWTAGAGFTLAAGGNAALAASYGLEHGREPTSQKLSLELQYRF
jgi:uncharacterized protein with beta-barrel porin domain